METFLVRGRLRHIYWAHAGNMPYWFRPKTSLALTRARCRKIMSFYSWLLQEG